MVASPGEYYSRTWGKYVGTALFGIAAWNAVSGGVHLYKSDSSMAKMWATRPAVVRAVIPSSQVGRLNLDLEQMITDTLDAPPLYGEKQKTPYSPPPMQKEEQRKAEEPWNAAEDWGPDLAGALLLNVAQKRMRNERRGNPDYWKFWQPQFWQYMLRGLL